MSTAQLVNRIIAKLGGDRVTFVRITQIESDSIGGGLRYLGSIVVFDYAHHRYIAYSTIRVRQLEHNSELYQVENDYSKSIEGVLNGRVRNEAGELV